MACMHLVEVNPPLSPAPTEAGKTPSISTLNMCLAELFEFNANSFTVDRALLYEKLALNSSN